MINYEEYVFVFFVMTLSVLLFTFYPLDFLPFPLTLLTSIILIIISPIAFIRLFFLISIDLKKYENNFYLKKF